MHIYCSLRNLYYAQSAAPNSQETSLQVMDRLCKYIYVNDNGERSTVRPRAMLCHIYHFALHDEWYKARDLMLISQLKVT